MTYPICIRLAYQCPMFKLGDGKGDDEIKVDGETEHDCVRECRARKIKEPSINGVTFGVTNETTGTWYFSYLIKFYFIWFYLI